MNILIIGGLLGLAVLAILAAVLLGMGEDRSEKAKKALEEQQANGTASLLQQAQPRQAAMQGPAHEEVPATPLLSRPTVPLPVPVSSAGETTGGLSLAALNGQVREITSELRALSEHAGELQRRLTTLSETLENHEQSHAEPPYSGSSADFFTADTETQVF